MAENFKIEQLDQAKLIKTNDLKQITNPILFNSTNGPTPDGLLSNEIFGITKDDRSGIFAYIDLNEYFIQPYLYRVWLKVDSHLREVVYETKNFRIDSNGYLVEDENGETGLKFLKKNIDRIKFKNTKRDILLKVLMDNKDKLFTKQFIVIPPFYRDVQTNGGKIGVGEINKLYTNLINTIKALSDSNDYGLTMQGGLRGKIQDIMLEIYNWFTVGESVVGGEHTGAGIFKKFGVMRQSVMSKTTDNSARLVISAANINVNSTKDLMVDMDHVAIPLSAACTVFYPFILYYLRQYFNNEFGGKSFYTYIDKNNQIKKIELKDPQIEFSDTALDKQISKFIYGYSNRFETIQIPNVENLHITMKFKGYEITQEEYLNGKRENEKIIERPLTWCDLLYQAAVEVSKDKMVLVTRYPIDSYFNQFACQCNISSTIETEPMVINGNMYKWYSKISEDSIGKDTSNKFIDTCSLSNPYCILMGADYDGDQVTVKSVYSIEANNELKKHKDSNSQYITLNGINGRTADKESIQAMYNLTLVLPNTQLSNPIF